MSTASAWRHAPGIATPAGALRVAVVGAGLMGRWHARYITLAGARVAAIVDCDRHAAERLRSRHRDARAFTDVATMLREARPDVAHVCTPDHTHVELIAALLSEGVHVLAEKPLAPTFEATMRLAALAQAGGARLCPVYQLPFQRGFARAREALARLGRMLRVEMTICSRGAERLGSGGEDRLLVEMLPHPASVLSLLWPDSALDAARWSVTRPRAGELVAHGPAREATASVYLSASARPPRCEARLLCERGTLAIDFFGGYAVLEPERRGRVAKLLQPFTQSASRSGAAAAALVHRLAGRETAYPGLVRLISEFHASVRGGDASPVPISTLMAVSEWCERVAVAIPAGEPAPRP